MNTVRPALSGTARDGQTVTTSTGTWTGTAPITYAFSWRRCDTSGNNCVTIPAATSQSYVIVPADVGSKLYALVTATNAAGSASQRTYLSGTVLGAPPLNTVRPALSGTARDGQTLTTSTGTWTGTAPITYAFSWRRCDASGNNCVTIPAATSQSYVIVPADVGSKLYALVTATNAAGSASQRSYLSGTVLAAPPLNTVRPALSGTARDGQTLHHLDRHLDRHRADHLHLLLAPLRCERLELRDDQRGDRTELRAHRGRRRIQGVRARHRHERRRHRLPAQLPERCRRRAVGRRYRARRQDCRSGFPAHRL